MRKRYIEVNRCFCTLYPSPMEADQRLLRSWRTRLALEGYDGNFYFVTLTYDDSHLPFDALPHREDVVKWIKRLRSYGNYHGCDLSKIRIFLASDFGGDYGRPHYHALIFGVPWGAHFSQFCLKTWKFGFVKIKPGNIQRINYVTKYLTKRHDPALYFTIKSNGIGNSFLDRPGVIDRIRSRNETTVSWKGTTYRLPRYMLNQVYPDCDEKQHILALESDKIDNRYYVEFLKEHGKDTQFVVYDGLRYNFVEPNNFMIRSYERQKLFDQYEQRRHLQEAQSFDIWRLRGLAMSKSRN